MVLFYQKEGVKDSKKRLVM